MSSSFNTSLSSFHQLHLQTHHTLNKRLSSPAATIQFLLFLPLFLCLFFAPGAGGNRGYGAIDTHIEDAIDEFVAATLSCREIVGLNLAVVQGNKTKLAKGYGLANLDRKSCVDDATMFGIASLTKAFAATLLGILLDKHKRYNCQ